MSFETPGFCALSPVGAAIVCHLARVPRQILAPNRAHARRPCVVGKDTETLVDALIKQAHKLPRELYKSLTWDRGKEMADHKRFSLATDVKVYFCDPQQPWQRGSNENTNGLLRQYFPKGLVCRTLTRTGSMGSQDDSTNDPEKRSTLKHRLNALANVLRRSVESAVESRSPQPARSGRCDGVKFVRKADAIPAVDGRRQSAVLPY